MARRKVRIRLKPVNTHKKIGLKKWDDGLRAFLKYETFEIRDYFEHVGRAFSYGIEVKQQRGVRKYAGDLKVVVGVLDGVGENAFFSFVNWGTAPRMIYPRRSRFLIFRPLYKAATTPHSLSVSPPWEKTGPHVFTYVVAHPGIEARRFDKLIQYLMQGEMESEGKRRVAKLAKQTWRA